MALRRCGKAWFWRQIGFKPLSTIHYLCDCGQVLPPTVSVFSTAQRGRLWRVMRIKWARISELSGTG